MIVKTQIPCSPSIKRISDLIGLIRREELILQPEFQRKLVWNAKHKEDFIDTLLNGYPFPEIYIAQSGVDLETLQTQQVVVDGQQRLSTIISYVDGKLQTTRIPNFAELSAEDKTSFLNYDVVIRDLKNISSETIKEVFRRINQTKYNLNSIEIQNALYDGEFISTGKILLTYFDPNVLPVFSDTDNDRMGDLYFILLLMATYEEGGYFSANVKTDEYIQRYDDEYVHKEMTISKFVALIDKIKKFALNPSSMWFRKSNFFTLFVELLKVDSVPPMMNEWLAWFEDEVMKNKDKVETDFGRYYAAMYTGTNSRTHRVERAEIFVKYYNELLAESK